MKHYTQLTYTQRCQIKVLKDSGFSQTKIAQSVGCSQSAISRELRRNRGLRGYQFKQAQRLCDERRTSTARALKMTPALTSSVEAMLRVHWSPEQICGVLRKYNMPNVSHERIYQHIWRDKRAGGTLYKHLRRSGRKYAKRSGGKTSRGRIIGRVGIEERPSVVDERSRVGDWEIDTVIGAKQQGVLVTIVERVTRFTLAAFSPSKTAEDVTATTAMLLAPYRDVLKTITADNGREFAWHDQITELLGAPVYFARPYHSWERGLNENTNGLIRQYWPKGISLNSISSKDCKRVIQEINNRPRKCLNFSSPKEMMDIHLAKYAN